jgi:hypothetical protein
VQVRARGAADGEAERARTVAALEGALAGLRAELAAKDALHVAEVHEHKVSGAGGVIG